MRDCSAAPEAERTALCDALLRSYAANLVALHVHPPALTTTPGRRPRAPARSRATRPRAGEMVTNLRHASVRIEDELGRRLVTLLDGTRDRAALAAELRACLVERGEPVPDDLAGGLERSLQGLARLALLEPARAGRHPAVPQTRVAPPGRGHTERAGGRGAPT